MDGSSGAECSEKTPIRAKKTSVVNLRKRSMDEEPGRSKDKTKGAEKRTNKKRRASDTSKKTKKEDSGDGRNFALTRHSSGTPESEPRLDHSDSPITDDVFEGSNSSQESTETLSMSSLLKSVLDHKKKVIFLQSYWSKW